MKAIDEQLIQMLADVTGLPTSSVTPASNLQRDLGLDSLDLVDLVLKLEDTFHIMIPDTDYPQLSTVASVIAYVEGKMDLQEA